MSIPKAIVHVGDRAKFIRDVCDSPTGLVADAEETVKLVATIRELWEALDGICTNCPNIGAAIDRATRVQAELDAKWKDDQ